MAEPAPADTLRAAIRALYGPDPGAQQQANQWLNSFNTQPTAWEANLQLVDPAGDADVSFFCSNALLTKVRAEWHKLSGEQQGQMASAIGGRFKAFLGHNHAQAKLATQRLGLTLAAIASLSGAQACQQFATECLGMVSVGSHMQVVECALLMLGALADELGNMDSSRRKGLVQATMAQWTDITHMVQALIPQQMAAGNYGLVHGALHCLQCWLKLDPQGMSSCRVSPGQLYSSQPSLLSVLFSLIGAEAAEAVTAERLEAMATEVLADLLGPGAPGTDSAVERAALDASMQALLQLRDKALQPGEAGMGTAKAVAALASVLAERDATAAAGCSAGALPLAALLLQCASRPERCVAEASVEYFLMLNTVPVEERAQELGAPLFGQLAPALFRHACYSGGFVSWDEEEEDEEAFNRFREQGLSELLETVYAMMGLPFLTALRDSLRAGSSWQEAEGALYCLKAVHARAKAQAAAGGSVGLETNAVLLSIFGELCSPSSTVASCLAHPLVCQTAAGAIGAYAAWFGSTEASPLEGALQLLLHALAHRESWQDAAQAFRALCCRCASRLAGSGALMGLMDVAARAVAPLPSAGQVCCSVSMEWEDRAAVQEGLARVIATLAVPEAAEAGTRLLAPHLARGQSIVAFGDASGTLHAAANGNGAGLSSNGNGAAHMQQQQQQQHVPAQQQLLHMLADELRLVAAIIKCMDFPGDTSLGMAHPAIRLLEAAWPLLTAVSESALCQQDPGLVEAVCAVYNRAVQAGRGAAKALLPMLLRSVLDVFVKHHHPACLDTLSAVTEAFGEVQSVPEVAVMQRQALAGAAAAAEAVLRARVASGQVLAASGDLLRALLAMADAHLVFARDLMLSSAALPVCYEWAVAAVGLREREPVAPALAFLSHLLGALAKLAGDATGDADVTAAVTGVVAGGGEALVRALLLGVCDTCPRLQLRSVAGVLVALLGSVSLGPAVAQWLLQGLQAPDLPGMSAGLLRSEDCQTFAKLVLRQPPLRRGRFDALIMDFAAIARGEGTSDTLLSYEM